MSSDAHRAVRGTKASIASGLAGLSVALALVPAVAVLSWVLRNGTMSIAMLELPRDGSGIGAAVVGTIELVVLASAIAIPVGVAVGLCIAELGATRLARALRFGADVLAGVPSILVGIFVYATFVVPMKHFSALAGAAALALVMVPLVTRTTDELARAVPDSLREAAMALGAPRWRIATHVVLRTAAPGIRAGCMIAVARVCGETAPLLFTAFDNRFWSPSLLDPTSSLQVRIFTYTMRRDDAVHAQAWAAALVLVGFVVALNLLARRLSRGAA